MKTTETYCVRCKKNISRRTKQNSLILVSSCAICDKKKSRFIKNQNASGLLRKLWIRTSLLGMFHLSRISYSKTKNSCFVLIMLKIISLK